MDTFLETVSVGMPKSDLKYLQDLAQQRGWQINTRESFLDKYIKSRPRNVDLTDDDIMAEVRAVRYGAV